MGLRFIKIVTQKSLKFFKGVYCICVDFCLFLSWESIEKYFGRIETMVLHCNIPFFNLPLERGLVSMFLEIIL